jgi:hypothetical protein
MSSEFPDEPASRQLRNISAKDLPDFFNEINKETGLQGLRHAELKRIKEPFQSKSFWFGG